MQRGFGTYERVARRTNRDGSSQGGESASPKTGSSSDTLPDPVIPGTRRASSAPSSPVVQSAVTVAAGSNSSAGKAWEDLPRDSFSAVSQGATATAAAADGGAAGGALGGVPPSTPSESGQQQPGEPSMGTILSEWFQKLFAPNDAGGNSVTPGEAESSKPEGTGASGEGTGADRLGSASASAGVTKDETDVPSNKTSLASDVRPPTPTQPASSAISAHSSAGADELQRSLATARETGTPGVEVPTEEDAPTEETAPAQDAGVTAPTSATPGEASTASNAGDAAQQEGSDPTVSPRFLGLFSRGFGSGGGSGSSVSAGVEKSPNDAVDDGNNGVKRSDDGKQQSGDNPTEGKMAAEDDKDGAHSSGRVGSKEAGVGAAGVGQEHDGARGDQGVQVYRAGVAVAKAAGATALAPLGEAGSGGAGGGDQVADGLSAEGASAGARAATGAPDVGGAPSSPARGAALSVASDDGEEEHLYTAGTHQGARPSIDDFSSLRVLGKGSYGKVVLVRRKETGVLYAMKILKKGDVVRKRQVERTKIERRVLGNVEHPFLMRLHYAFQTDNKLYLVLDYCPGGELFFHLSRYKRFPEGVVRFYAAELVLALKHLHDNNIIYRDIKPENILLDAEGHIKLGDFGLAKDNVTDATFGAQSVCGTPEYMAPEVINKSGHGTAVDWWGLGMLMYEMLTGLPPWYTKDRQKLFERLRNAPLVIPKNISAPSASIIGGLLTRNPVKRLGTLGALQVMNHEFFRGLDWAALLAKRITAPLNPCRNQRQGSESTVNFDPQFTRMPIDTIAVGGSVVSPGPDGHFDGFTYEMPTVLLEGDEEHHR